MTLATSTVRAPDTTSAAFERSLVALATWLEHLAAVAETAPDPAPADVRMLDELLADVWTAAGRDGVRGIARDSVEQARLGEVVGPVFAESACLRHCIAKPRGYPGDFEIMQKVYDNVPAGATPRGRWLDAWLLALPYSRAVRNRAAMIMGLLAQTWTAGGRRVANVAAGCASELAAVHRFLPFEEITLLDQDAEALDAATRAIGVSGATRVRSLRHAIRDVVSGRCELEPGQNLVYSIGLYDYLSRRTAAALTVRLWNTVAPDGVLAIGNFAAGEHPDRYLLDGALEWYLHYRSPAELLDLAAGLPDLDEAHVRTDPTGSLHLLIAHRAGVHTPMAVTV